MTFFHVIKRTILLLIDLCSLSQFNTFRIYMHWMDTPTTVLISFQNLLLYIDLKYSHWNMVFFFQLSTWTPLQNTMYQSVTLCAWYSVSVKRNPFRFLGGFLKFKWYCIFSVHTHQSSIWPPHNRKFYRCCYTYFYQYRSAKTRTIRRIGYIDVLY